MKKGDKINYETCELQDHDDEFLNMVCLDDTCSNHQLLCAYCQENHQKCKTTPLKKFLLEFRAQMSQLHEVANGPKVDDLLIYYEQMKETLENAQKLINEIFNKTKNVIAEANQQIQQAGAQESGKQIQAQKLKDFEQTKNQDNFIKLIQEIESFKVNQDKYSFTIKKPSLSPIDKLQDRIDLAKLYSQQYQSAMNTFTESFSNQHELLRKSLQNFSVNAAPRLTEELPESGRFDRFKSNQMFTPVIAIQPQNNQINQSIIAIDEDLEEIEKNKDKQKEINTNQQSSTASNSQKQSLSKQKLPQFQQQKNVQQEISLSEILETPYQPKTIFESNQKLSNNQSLNGKISHNQSQIAQKLQSQVQRKTEQQIFQTPQTQQKQLQTNTNQIQQQNISQQQIIPSPIIQPVIQQVSNNGNPQQPTQAQHEEEQQEETVLNVCQENEFQTGKDINRMIFLGKDIILTVSQNIIGAYQISTGTKQFETQCDHVISDIGYQEIDEQNGNLYVANKKGRIDTYLREGTEICPVFKLQSSQSVDKPGGNILIQLNGIDKALYLVGDDRAIKQFTLKNLKETKKADVPDSAQILFNDQKLCYAGCQKQLFFWDSQSNQKKTIAFDQKIVSISAFENKIAVATQDTLKIYERNILEFKLFHEKKFELITTMSILKNWPICMVSCQIDNEQQIILYNHEGDSYEKLNDNLALVSTVKEINKTYQVCFAKEKGQCAVYRVEQTLNNSQQN